MRLMVAILLGVGMASAGDELPNFDRMWDYRKPGETEKRFRELLPAAEKSGNPEYHLQLLTQIARTLGLQEKFEEAHAQLDEVEKLLTEETKVARIRYLLERGRTFRSGGKPEKARPIFLEAWEFGNKAGLDFYAVDAAHMMELVEPQEKKLAWNEKAMALAEKSEDKRAKGWLPTLYNNCGWSYYEQGKYEQSLVVLEKCWELHRKFKTGEGERIAKWSVAKLRRKLGRVDEALKMQTELLEEWKEAGSEDGFVFEEYAECLLAKGKADEAKPHFEKAWELLQQYDWIEKDEPERWARLRKLAGK